VALKDGPLADVTAPTLEDLREVPEAAWLWDGARARIVWANRAGIAYFGGASLFDLVDRPFDFTEPGVEQVMNLGRSLRRGQVETALLHFPSSGQAVPLSCRCMIHALGDGRPGVLVVARQSAMEQQGEATGDILAAFDLLPTAAVLVGRDGRFRHLNAAALLLLGAAQRASLQGLLGSDATAEEFLARTEAAGTMVVFKPLAVRLGTRDIRMTAKRLNRVGDTSSFALLLLDDVTERRALELKLSGADAARQPGPAPDMVEADATAPSPAATSPAAPDGSLSKTDAEAFAELGRVLEDSIRQMPPRHGTAPAHQKTAPPPPQPRRSLQRLPDQLRLTLEGRPEPVLVARDGQLLYANPAAARLFGYDTAEDVINDRRLSERFGGLGQALPVSTIEGDGGRMAEASVDVAIIPWLGGPARQFVLHATPHRATTTVKPAPATAIEAVAGGMLAEAASARPSADVIQLPARQPPPEADQELRAILDTAADGIITLDPEARIHTFSAGAEAIFGYRIAEVAGKPFVDLLTPDSRKTLRDYLAALQGPGLAAVFNDGREVTAQVKQGGTVPLFLTIGRLQAPRPQAAFCAVVRDITQWKKTEAELREAKERAETASRQKSEFLASISHELRTPLNAIMGFSEVMRLGRFGEIENEKYRGYVHDIHASGAHLLSLINDLLDLSKVEAGKLELNFTSVNLGDVADYALKLLQEQATAARVVLRKSMPADVPNVVADLRSMRQVMLNLLSNAIKFTDAGGQVVVSAQLLSSGELKLKVKDTGIGMDEEQVKDALEPFRRVTTEGRSAEGTGLGLPLTKALVEANRARFILASEPRKGTLVEIIFPTTRVLAE
jgi:PAS domain S-box-containing protein